MGELREARSDCAHAEWRCHTQCPLSPELPALQERPTEIDGPVPVEAAAVPQTQPGSRASCRLPHHERSHLPAVAPPAAGLLREIGERLPAARGKPGLPLRRPTPTPPPD